MKKIFKIIGVLILIVIVVVAVFIITYQPKQYSDFEVFTSLENLVISLVQQYNATERPITKDFKEFSLTLAFPYNKVFGSSVIGVPLKSFQDDKMAAVTISHFEVPAQSGYYRDFTLNIRPHYGIKAPVLHIDFMKPALGTPGMCIMDFFNVDKENISWEQFFSGERTTIEKATSIVEKYQRSKKEGRGKITKYLDPYKSPYRFELKEPNTKDENIRREYYTSVEEAFQLAIPAYFKCLHEAQRDESYATRHQEKTKEFLQLMYTNDIAIALGKRIFKEHFKKYWQDGFWNVEIELKD